MKTAVQFGAGNIGRGFMAQLFWEAGYRTIFVEANEGLVEMLNERKAYTLRLLDAYKKQEVEVSIDRFEALHIRQELQIADRIARANLLCTAVGDKNLALVAPLIAEGLRLRRERGGPPVDVWLCENLLGASDLLAAQVAEALDQRCRRWLKQKVGFVATAVARMVPAAVTRRPEDDPLLVVSDAHHELPYDAGAAKAAAPEIIGLKPVRFFQAEMERKIFTHNLGHALLAYLGKLKGYTYVHEGLQDPSLSADFDATLGETARALLKKYPAYIESEEHARILRDVKIRFGNPMLMDTIKRVGKDPMRKLGPHERLIGSAELCSSQGIFPERILTVCGAALCYDEPDDAGSVRLQRMISEQGIDSVIKEVTGLDSAGELGSKIKQCYLEIRKTRGGGASPAVPRQNRAADRH